MLNRVVLHLIIYAMLAGLLVLGAGLGNSIAISNLNHPHHGVGCGSCHSFRSRVTGDSGENQRPRSTAQCLECHINSMSSDRGTSIFHQFGYDCTDCHSFHQPERLTINGDTTTIALARSESQLCADCHKTTDLPEVSPGHREAAKLLHGEPPKSYSDNPSSYCLTCHDASSTASPLSSAFAPPRLNMSASHPYDVKLTAGFLLAGSGVKLQNEIDPSIRTSNGNVTCISCHSLTSHNPDLLVTSIQDGLCTGCHDMKQEFTSPTFTQEE